MLKITNLSLKINNKQILENISFEVKKGDIFCVLGKNGAGKSILIKTILGIYDQFEGIIIIDGMNIELKPRNVYLSRIGALIEQAALYPQLSAYENLSVISKYYTDKKIDKKRINEVLEMVGLAQEQSKPVRFFSQGMKQRLGLGMAILHQPEIIILDEPNNTLDPEAIIQLRNLILKLNKEFGCTFLINTHHLEESLKLSKRFIILKNGQKVYESDENKAYYLVTYNQAQWEQHQNEASAEPIGYFTKDECRYELFDKKQEELSAKGLTISTPTAEEIFLAFHHSTL
ncbi:MAG: ABC transporter ATP-binding protein [Cytophagales bacterium]|nr:MAG: ABC transporter ATP-binding protein [Cytophagales bacterium]